MSDEVRQTRLLKFRLRRRGASPFGPVAGRPRTDAPADAELRAVLGAWETPAPPDAARDRLLQAFRQQAARVPRWRRVLTASVRVPLPVAACACVALAAFAFTFAARWTQASQAADAAAQVSAPTVRFVEVPVPQERVVERVVYVERKERRGDEDSPRPQVKSARPRAEGQGRGPSKATSYFTRVDMAEFQPADAMKFRIIKKGKADED
jgi:hypothetical protein